MFKWSFVSNVQYNTSIYLTAVILKVRIGKKRYFKY